MIRSFVESDLESVNKLLSEFNYKLDFNSPYRKVLVYIDKDIKGVLVYDLIIDRIEIEYIIVSKDYRNKGIGKSLLDSMEKVDNISLEVRSDNEIAINFYESNGFKKEAIRKNYYKDIDGILMVKR